VSRRLRILLASPAYWPAHAFGGPVVVARELVSRLVARGHAVEVLTTTLRDVAPTEASRINASIPFSSEDNPRAPSTVFRAASPGDQFRSLQCLAEAIYYEARSESEDGQRAVAQVAVTVARRRAAVTAMPTRRRPSGRT
jgi:hypothetical protein